jgi:phosphoribosylanthranilate isomerase
MSTIHVKICGITNLVDAQVAVAAGADLLGFILYPKSPRYVAPAVIREIIREIRRLETGESTSLHSPVSQSPLSSLHSPLPKFVGVFVHEPVEQIAARLILCSLDYAQLHSEEPPEALAALAGRAFKAVRPTSPAEALAEAARFAPLGPTPGPALMIDAHDPTAYGGTGKTADWQAAAAVARQHPGLLLAGGLTPATVAQAIRTVQPWGVDVSSGVEARPGCKDHDKVRAFVAAARGLP